MRRLPPKRLGQAVEAKFLAQCSSRGLIVAKLWGESDPFDFYVSSAPEITPARVQVKTGTPIKNRSYQLNCAKSHSRPVALTESDTDFIAGHVLETDDWYIIPITATRAVKAIYVFPHKANTRSRFEQYRNNWEPLLRPQPKITQP